MIPVYRPFIGEEEKLNVNECLDTSWISSRGRFVQEFEKQFSKVNNNEYAVSVCNGTVALHLALAALDIKDGDEIIVPTFTYVASVNCIRYCRAIPVFVDSCADDWQMNPAEIEKKITPKTKAILCVHLYGHPCNMTAIMNIAQKNKLFVVEDCAEAFGSKHNNRNVGTFGDISTFSFFGNKTITTGEGGMVVTNNKTLYEKISHLRGQGVSPDKEYWHDIIGYNYRMTNIAAAIGLAQLKRAKEFIKRKREIAKIYKSKLNLKYEFHCEKYDNYHTYWMCSILLPQGFEEGHRNNLRKFLLERGIETRPLFYPIHNMPMYATKEKFPVSQDISMRGINLPSFPTLSNADIDYVITIINSWC